MLVAEGAVEIRVLSRQGKSIREIARMLEVSRNTVRRYLRSKALPQYQREARQARSLQAVYGVAAALGKYTVCAGRPARSRW
jgi:transposase